MSDYKVTYDDVDLSPCCERGMTDYVFTIDPLAAETDEQRTERKKSEREAFPGWAHVISTALTFLIVAGVFAVVGTVIGNQRNSDVTDLWKFVPSLSGERAEPEESAK